MTYLLSFTQCQCLFTYLPLYWQCSEEATLELRGGSGTYKQQNKNTAQDFLIATMSCPDPRSALLTAHRGALEPVHHHHLLALLCGFTCVT